MHRNVDLAAGGVEVAAEKAESEPVRDRESVEDLAAGGLIEGFGRMDEEERDFTVERVAKDRRFARAEARTQRRSERRAAVVAERTAAHRDARYWQRHLHDALLLSLTGAKGAITLAVLLTIPISLASGGPFPERDLILFLASGVILLSLLLTNIAVPLLAPKKKEELPPESELAAILDIYRTVIYQLAESVGDSDKTATNEVIRHYTSRLQAVRETNDYADPVEDQMRVRAIDWELAHTLELIDEGKVSIVVGLLYLNQMSHIKARVEHHNSVRWEVKALFEQLRHRLHQIRRIKEAKRAHRLPALQRINRRTVGFELRGLVFENLRCTIERLESLRVDESVDETERKVAEQLIAEFQRRLERGTRRQMLLNSSQRAYEKQLLAVQARALAFERDSIEATRARGAISRDCAKMMRDNVAMMELDIEEQLE
jgi:CPA1 family monovalent cation:H+ antiporter